MRSHHSAVPLFINKLPSEHKRTLLCQSSLSPLLFFLFVPSTALVPCIQLFEQRGLTFSWGQLYSPAVCCHCRAAKEPSQGLKRQGPAVMSILYFRGGFLAVPKMWIRIAQSTGYSAFMVIFGCWDSLLATQHWQLL